MKNRIVRRLISSAKKYNLKSFNKQLECNRFLLTQEELYCVFSNITDSYIFNDLTPANKKLLLERGLENIPSDFHKIIARSVCHNNFMSSINPKNLDEIIELIKGFPGEKLVSMKLEKEDFLQLFLDTGNSMYSRRIK